MSFVKCRMVLSLGATLLYIYLFPFLLLFSFQICNRLLELGILDLRSGETQTCSSCSDDSKIIYNPQVSIFSLELFIGWRALLLHPCSPDSNDGHNISEHASHAWPSLAPCRHSANQGGLYTLHGTLSS